MGANRRIREVGQFAWRDADLGVECLRCGGVRVFCDFEALDCFRERGWSRDTDDAARRLRCPCGSGEVRLIPVPIFKRPRPLPVRPTALRPIYSEDGRTLRRRGAPSNDPAGMIEQALVRLVAIADAYPNGIADPAAVGPAIDALRPYVYRTAELQAFAAAVCGQPDPLVKGQAVTHALTGIFRQLGKPRP